MSGYVPKLIQQIINRKSGDIVTSLDWNTILNLLINQGDDTAVNLESLYNILYSNYSNTAAITEMINNKIIQIGTSDMAKAVYDTNDDGIVDKAAAVIDNSIITSNLRSNAVTETKLAIAVQTKLNKIHSAMFKIDFNNAEELIVGELGTYVTLNDTYFFNLGFTPKAVLIFNTNKDSTDTGSSYVRQKSYYYANFGYYKFYEYSSYDIEEKEDYGGFASTGSPAIGLATGLEVFSIATNGINIRNYTYSREKSDGSTIDMAINLAGSFCIAIG